MVAMTQVDLWAGILKRIYIDPVKLRKGEHAWTLRTEQGTVVASALSCGGWDGIYSREPLFPDGPNCWLESDIEFNPQPGVEVTRWPVPLKGPAATDLDLSAGVRKRVHVNRHLAKVFKPAWTMRTDAGTVVADCFELADGLRGVQSRQPLFPRGPTTWIEAEAEVVVEAEHRIHQTVLPEMGPMDVPPVRGHRG